MISNVHSVEMNSTGLTGEYKLYLELNGSSESESISLHLPYGSGRMLRLNSQKDLIPLLWLMNWSLKRRQCSVVGVLRKKQMVLS